MSEIVLYFLYSTSVLTLYRRSLDTFYCSDSTANALELPQFFIKPPIYLFWSEAQKKIHIVTLLKAPTHHMCDMFSSRSSTVIDKTWQTSQPGWWINHTPPEVTMSLTGWDWNKLGTILTDGISMCIFVMEMYEFRLTCHWNLFLIFE